MFVAAPLAYCLNIIVAAERMELGMINENTVTADRDGRDLQIPPGIEKSFLGLKILPGRISRSREGFGRNQNFQAHQIPPVASGNYRLLTWV